MSVFASIRSRAPAGRTAVVAAAFIAALLASGCSGAPAPDPPAGEADRPPSRLLVVGLDGFEWKVALPLVQAGKMPALRSLMESGTFGRLRTLTPTMSPVIWTSIATGKYPEHHGILDLVLRDGEGEMFRPYYSTDRSTKALWNIFTDYEMNVSSIGWWKTYPVEAINGLMVSQLNALFAFSKGEGGVFRGITRPGEAKQVYPVERHERIMQVAASIQNAMAGIEPQIFSAPAEPLPGLAGRLHRNIRWVVGLDAMHFRIALEELKRRKSFNLAMVYLRGADVVSHAFWRFAYPGGYAGPPSGEELRAYGRMVSDYYRYLDSLVGELAAAAGPGTTLMLVSDHGMGPIAVDRDWSVEPSDGSLMSGGHDDAPPAFFVAAGPGIARSTSGPIDGLSVEQLALLGHVTDVAPTLLALAGLPVGEDMDGSPLAGVIDQAFLARHPASTVATHDDPDWRDRMNDFERDHDEEKDRIEELRSLGYIE